MEQITKKRRLFSPRTGTIIAITVIVLAALSIIISGPREAEHDTLFGDEATPTIQVTSLLEKANVNRSIDYQGVHVAFGQVMLAKKFSDDRKSVGNVGKYTVRVFMDTKNNNQSSIGIEYASLMYLVLPNGDRISPKLLSVKAAELPGQGQSGFADFPVVDQVSLATLKLQFDNTQFPMSPSS
jgi:hypothetical protein